jgi:ABC-type enterochelin transport system substrate-binding protein
MQANVEKERIALDKKHYIDSWESYIDQLGQIWSDDEKERQALQEYMARIKQIVNNNADRTFN